MVKLRILLGVLMLCNASWVAATTITAEMVGSKVSWTNAELSSNLKPSFWSSVQGLPPTNEWNPGGLLTSAAATVRLTNGSNVVEAPITVIGLEYNSVGLTLTELNKSASNACNQYELRGALVSVMGVGCQYPKYLSTGSGNVSPFSFVRPILQVGSLNNAFNGKPKGIYYGTVSYSYEYGYKVPVSGVYSRLVQTNTLAVEIDFTPSFVTDVVITGDNKLDVRYDLNRGVVTGVRDLNIKATGLFTNGLNVSLVPGRSQYNLRGPSSIEIPYSILCAQCSQPQLVQQGRVVNGSTVVPGSNVNNIDFRLNVSFEHIGLSSLESGNYQDTFTLMFSPNI